MSLGVKTSVTLGIAVLLLSARLNKKCSVHREDTLQRWRVSNRVNSSRAADEDPTLTEIEVGAAMGDEIAAASNFIARERL